MYIISVLYIRKINSSTLPYHQCTAYHRNTRRSKEDDVYRVQYFIQFRLILAPTLTLFLNTVVDLISNSMCTVLKIRDLTVILNPKGGWYFFFKVLKYYIL